MDEGANKGEIQTVTLTKKHVQMQTNGVRVYRGVDLQYKLKAAAVDGFLASNEVAKVHYGGGQVTRIDLKEKAFRGTSQATVVRVGPHNWWHRSKLSLLNG